MKATEEVQVSPIGAGVSVRREEGTQRLASFVGKLF